MSATIPPQFIKIENSATTKRLAQATDPENTAELLQLSADTCRDCGFDMDRYKSGGTEYLFCCNCENVVPIPPKS